MLRLPHHLRRHHQTAAGALRHQDHVHRPEYQTIASLGGLLMNDNLEAVIKATDICNRYGIDTMGVGGAVAMAMGASRTAFLPAMTPTASNSHGETPKPL